MGCTAQSPKKVKVKKAAKIEFADSTVQKNIGDSIFHIMMKGKVKAMLVNNDAKCNEMKYLSREDHHLLRFLLTEPKLYAGTVPVHGKFLPCISFEFYKSRSELVYINLDFGLKEWTLTNKSGKVLYNSSLSSNDLLRFCHKLYPANEFIKKHYYSTRQ